MATPPVFTSGAILTAAQMNAVGMWLVKSQVIGSAVSNVTVTDAFTSDFDNYFITISGSSISANQRLRMTLGGSAGSTYSYGGWRSSYSAAVIDSEQGSATTAFLIGLPNTGIFAVGVHLFSPQKATATFYTSFASGSGFAMQQSGIDTNAAASTAFTIDPDSTATLTGGTIRVYGYNN